MRPGPDPLHNPKKIGLTQLIFFVSLFPGKISALHCNPHNNDSLVLGKKISKQDYNIDPLTPERKERECASDFILTLLKHGSLNTLSAILDTRCQLPLQ